MAFGLSGCSSGPPPPEDDSARSTNVQAHRMAKDQMFKSSSESPLLPEDKATFTGLPYFPFDLKYRVPASLRQDEEATGTIIELPTSAQELRRMRRVGTLRFALDGATHHLTAFVDASARTVDELFVPFADVTSGRETYAGGRYLELRRTATGLYDLDFNLAYHPFCVFNPSYICPVPPKENRLSIAILAGERLKP